MGAIVAANPPSGMDVRWCHAQVRNASETIVYRVASTGARGGCANANFERDRL
jgi:hypothetical protein